MDNTELLDSNYTGSGLVVTDEAKAYFREAARWSTFLGILGFVMSGLLVLAGIGASVAMSALGGSSDFSTLGFNPAFLGLFYIILGVIYIFPSLYMYNFGSKTKRGIDGNDQAAAVEGWRNLKSFFRFMGIFAIIALVVYALAIIGIGVFGAYAASNY